MLHDILWNGLRKDLKDASGHKYDSIKDFDSLRVAIRQIGWMYVDTWNVVVQLFVVVC
jgi:hypothetical protein